MIEIPQQLRKKQIRFVKIARGEKSPFEKDWQKTNNYQYDDPKLIKHLQHDNNYGVLCGEKSGNLIVIDADHQDVSQACLNQLPETFTVQTSKPFPSHFYYFCNEINKKIVLSNDKKGNHYGEVQSIGAQVVGPWSRHPSGKTYTVIINKPIARVTKEQVLFALKDFLQETDKNKNIITTNEDKGLKITNIIDISKMKNKGDEYQGAHPIHGSTTGANFTISPSKNAWYCFRHEVGGGPLSLIAIKEKILTCDELKNGKLTGQKFKKTKKIAKEKYGYKDTKNINDELTDDHGKILPDKVAEYITSQHNLITKESTEEIYYYDEGYYKPNGKVFVQKKVKKLIQGEMTIRKLAEILLHVKTLTFKPEEEIQENPMLIHLKNGILNLKTMQIEPFTPEKISFTQIPVKYNPEADCPNFKKFLKEITSSEEDYSLLQEIIGYMLYKRYNYHKAVMLVGEGANGKSTLINTIKTFLGPKNVTAVAPQDFEGNRFRIATLQGKLANLYPDISDKAMRSMGIFKALTGEDTIIAENKFGKPFELTNYAKMMFSCNKVPRIDEDNNAIWRRWIIINFEKTFEGEKADKEILKKMTTEEELSGILNFAIEGLKRLLKNDGFTYNKTNEEVRKYYIRMSDPAKAFFIDRIIEKTGGMIKKEDLYGEFVRYCKENKLTPVTDNVFAKRVLSSFSGVRASRVRENNERINVWTGIDFIPQEELKQEEEQENKKEEKIEIDDLGEI